MRITLTRDTLVSGEHHATGETVDVSDADARYLVAIGKAALAPVEVEKAEAREGVVTKAVPGTKRPKRATR